MRGASSGESRRPRRLYGVGADSEAPALDGRRADTHRSGPPHQSGTLEPQPDEKETQYLEQTNDVRPDLSYDPVGQVFWCGVLPVRW